jgi:hypothetical protein
LGKDDSFGKKDFNDAKRVAVTAAGDHFAQRTKQDEIRPTKY